MDYEGAVAGGRWYKGDTMRKYIFVKPALLAVYTVTAVISALIAMSFAFIMAALVNLVMVKSVRSL